MVSNALSTLSLARPMTTLDTLKAILDEPDDLSQYLPIKVVQQIDLQDIPAGHMPHRIKFGVINKARGASIEVYAYISTSQRQRDIPEIHFFGRQPHGSLKSYRQEDVTMEGELDVELQPAKDSSSPTLLVLLQCLFILKGVAMPVDCAVSARFISDARTVCYRFRTHINGPMRQTIEIDLDESMTSLEIAPPTPSHTEAGSPPLWPVLTITTTAHKRPHSSISHQSSVVDDNTQSMHQEDASPVLDLHREYTQLTGLHEQKFDSKTRIRNVDNIMTAFLHTRHICERKDLIAGQQVELQEVLKGLRDKHDAQAQAQYDQHMLEVEARWQKPNRNNEELIKKLSALRDEKRAKEEELAHIEVDIERQRKVLQSMPNMWQAIEGEVENNTMRKRMRMDDGRN